MLYICQPYFQALQGNYLFLLKDLFRPRQPQHSIYQFFEELYDVQYEITAKIVIEPHNSHKKKKAKKSKSRFKAWQHNKTPKQKKR